MFCFTFFQLQQAAESLLKGRVAPRAGFFLHIFPIKSIVEFSVVALARKGILVALRVDGDLLWEPEVSHNVGRKRVPSPMLQLRWPGHTAAFTGPA